MAVLDNRFAGTLGRIDGDQELFDELAAYFSEDAPQLLAEARKGTVAKDSEMVARAVHGLRGQVATFDAETAVAITKLVGQKVSVGEWSAIPAALDQLETEIESLKSHLKEFRDGR